ncbi:XdhC family protein [Rhodospirillaceae bacterium SYSU D60014]|uniref:XdhC family protein n=1 Tax=Virgifigura deserti TaxID=2268457 RepID=UPI000E66F768
MKRAILDRLVADRAADRPVALATDLESGLQSLIYEGDTHGDFVLDSDILATARQALRDDRSAIVEAAGRRIFLQVHNPALRLILVGAVHIAQALAPMARLAGYAVTVIDPRRSFATEARFPDMALLTDWPDEAMERLALDGRTAVVTLTHDPKLDDPALQAALRSPAFYIGALGSRKTHAARLERLRAAGVGDTDLARIHGGPVGLPLGGRSPAEIALSVLAQITTVLHRAGSTQGHAA